MQSNMQDKLTTWYQKNKRDLPFRHTHDPYAIWISEIMLQQTTVAAVIPYYQHFLETFPTVLALASASLDDVYKCWEGLGYYRRAKHLHESAQMIVDDFHGLFPTRYEDVIALKGVGPYTASAIMAFAYGASYAAIDGNALRVLSRFYGLSENIALASTQSHIRDIANDLVQGHDASAFNQGMMDLANALCRPLNPQCLECPLKDECLSYKNHQEKVLPINIKKIKRTETSFITGYVTYKNKLLLTKNEEGLLEHMYGLPQFDCESPYDFMEQFSQSFGKELYVESFIKDFKHVFTHRTWHMHVYHFVLTSPLESLYTQEETEMLAIPTAHKKILDYIKKEHTQDH